jgi:ubiquitin-protein ligase
MNQRKERRLHHEFNIIRQFKHDRILIEVPNCSYLEIMEIKARLDGGDNTPYAGRTFSVAIKIGELYPLKPINIIFETFINHLNISSGIICPKCIIDYTDVSTTNLCDIFLFLLNLLDHPHDDCAFNGRLYEIYKRNPDKYLQLLESDSESLSSIILKESELIEEEINELVCEKPLKLTQEPNNNQMKKIWNQIINNNVEVSHNQSYSMEMKLRPLKNINDFLKNETTNEIEMRGFDFRYRIKN